MKKTLAIIGTVSILLLASLFLSLSSQSQTVNMGRTYVSSQNVRYANEGGTGTTVNKLAKLTGAPSTAILTAITDTSGINFLDVNSVSNTDFITADEVMYAITSDNSTFPIGVTIFSWKEETIP